MHNEWVISDYVNETLYYYDESMSKDEYKKMMVADVDTTILIKGVKYTNEQLESILDAANDLIDMGKAFKDGND
jgi:predicted P-loop ATPase/GTPase